MPVSNSTETPTAAPWKSNGEVDEYGAQEYRSHYDGVYMQIRMFGEHAQFAIGEHE